MPPSRASTGCHTVGAAVGDALGDVLGDTLGAAEGGGLLWRVGRLEADGRVQRPERHARARHLRPRRYACGHPVVRRVPWRVRRPVGDLALARAVVRDVGGPDALALAALLEPHRAALLRAALAARARHVIDGGLLGCALGEYRVTDRS